MASDKEIPCHLEQRFMDRLTTHVLGTTRGKSGTAIAVVLYRIEGEQRQILQTYRGS